MAHVDSTRWNKLASVASIRAALDRYYRPERLNGDAGMADRLAESTKSDLVRDDGFTVMASRHESITGRALWILARGEHFEIYQSTKR